MDTNGHARGAPAPENTSAQATSIAVFGGAGDLSWRKLVPAIFDLYLDGRLAEPFRLVALDRQDLTVERLLGHLKEGVDRFSRHGPAASDRWQAFASHVEYMRADFEDPASYRKLAGELRGFDTGGRPSAAIFYCATPPSLFGPIAENVAGAGFGRWDPDSRIVLEKPFGYDLASAQRLNQQIEKHFDERQIFRIDHFLGKETVQNVLALRFANPTFEPLWDRRYVSYVAISVAETLGVGHRGDYYDGAGCLRDMVQNHLLQLLCMIAMEAPVAVTADEVRNKKVDVLHAVRPIAPDEVGEVAVRGQYSRGHVDGLDVEGYRDEPGVAAGSDTETFCALKLFVDDSRWQGVPFYLRTGKRLPQDYSEIVVGFNDVPHEPFPPEAVSRWNESLLAVGMQPYQGCLLRLQAKRPGPQMFLESVDMHFTYRDAFDVPVPEPYETLIFDVMAGDPMLFMRADQVEAAWAIVDPVLDAWAGTPPERGFLYPAGMWGPLAAEDLVARDGHSWPGPCLVEPLAPAAREPSPSKAAASKG